MGLSTQFDDKKTAQEALDLVRAFDYYQRMHYDSVKKETVAKDEESSILLTDKDKDESK